MTRKISWACGSLILFFPACIALAGEQTKQQADSNIPEKIIKKVPARAVDANAPTGAMQQEQVEQVRQRAREKIRQHPTERRARTLSPADANEPNVHGRPRIPMTPQTPQMPIDKTTQFQEQLIAIEQQLAYEKDKHLDRIARLNRIRELAQQQGDNEAVARTDTLIEKENQLYQMKTQRMEMRKERVNQFLEKGPPSTDANRSSPSASPAKRAERAARTGPAEIEKKPEGLKAAKDSNQPPAQNK
jgi:hypothetical protein